MAMPIIAVPQFPDVPNVPGVPSLNRMVGNVLEPRFAGIGGLPIAIGVEIADRFGSSGLIRQDNPNLPAPRPAEVWGLFDSSGQAVVIADSVVSVEYRNDTHISNYPQEEGAFAAYNKVATPYRIRIRMSKGGTVEDRHAFLTALEDVSNASNVDLYSVVTPERTYDSANVTGIDYMREQRSGAAMLIVELIVEEIRVTALAIYTNTQQPTGMNPVNVSNIQSVTPPTNLPLPAAPNTPNSNLILNAFHLMLLIPLSAIPNQTFNILLGGQNCLINVAQKSTGVFVTLSVSGNSIVEGSIADDRVLLVREPYLGFIGDLAFFDQLYPYTSPYYTGFDGRYQFVYLEASEL